MPGRLGQWCERVDPGHEADSGGDADTVSLVNTSAPSASVRFATRASLPLVALGLALVAAPAHADAAEGWSDAGEVDNLHALLLLVGVPLLIFVLIALAVYVPAMVRGENVSALSSRDDEWFGGPRQGTKELPSGGDLAESSETGGARGTW